MRIRKWQLLSVFLVLTLVVPLAAACVPAPEPEVLVETVVVTATPAPEPPEGISLEEAVKIVIEKIAEPSEAPHGLRAHVYPEVLPKGSTVVPFSMWGQEEKEEFVVCEQDCWFFWFDDDPLAHFAHDTRFVFVEVLNGNVTVKKTNWWPVVNGNVMWGTADERASDELLIYEKQPQKIGGEPVVVGPTELKPVDLHASPGCEAWAIIVCGYDDVSDSFDEDIHGIYNVLTGLGYADDHIFYVSPWTTDPGVDRVTSTANVQWAINQVAANSDAEDKVFFFYTSHGGVDSLSCNPGAPGGGSISSTSLDAWLDGITCRDMTILIEACHSGSFIGAYSTGTVVAAENELTGDGETNRIVMTATDTDHSSYGDVDNALDPNPGDTGSEFPGGYIEAFGVAAADVDGNGVLSVGEAYQYAWDNDAARLSGSSFPQMDPTSLTPSDVFHLCAMVDVWISDGSSDTGNNSYDYDSTDIWSSLSPTGTSHEDPVSGLTNYVHVRVHNLGSSAASNVDVTLYWGDTSAALAWPADFNQIGATHTFASIPAGGSVERTWSWYVDPAFGLGHHFCFVATADCTADPMTGGFGTYVAPYDNNIAQKNITIVLAHAGQPTHVWFFIENNMDDWIPFDLVIRRADFPEGQLILTLPDDLTEVLLEREDLLDGLKFVEREGRPMPALLVTAQEDAVIRQIELEPMERRAVVLEIVVPEDTGIGEEFTVRIEEATEKQEVIGANTFVIRVVAPGDCLSTLRRAAEVCAQIALKYGSGAAEELLKMIGDALEREICEDRQAVMEWKYAIFDLEVELGKELEGQVPEEMLQAYFGAIEALNAALEAGGFAEVMIAQEKVVEAAERFLTAWR